MKDNSGLAPENSIRLVEITTVIGCINACSYCPQDILMNAYSKISNIMEMGFDIFKTCVDKIPNDVAIYFCGMCEPWLNRECTNMLLYAHKIGHRIGVDTTLVNMNLQDVELLKKCSFEHFSVHLPSAQKSDNINIDENYLKVLEKVSKSGIKISYHSRVGKVPTIIESVIGREVPILGLHSRGGNLAAYLTQKKRGIIGCKVGLNYSVLLPDGSVVLCCNDFGMKHILGNLKFMDYESLFRSEEFLRIKKGLKDESIDIVCRHCESLTYDIDIPAKLHNFILPRIAYCRKLLIKHFLRLFGAKHNE